MRIALPLVALVLVAAPRAGAAADPVSQHVESVAARLAPHLQRQAPSVRVDESATARVTADASSMTITTGLLAVLESDAQLAMVLGFELARRHDAPARSSDERAAAAGMRALVAAGWDGGVALRTWDRLSAATLLGGPSAYGDASVNARRRKAAARALAQSGQRRTAGSGHAVGLDSYRTEVLSRLEGWKLEAPPAPAPGHEAAAASEWLTYRRSGGFTGWTAELRIASDGARFVRESQAAAEAGPRAPLTPQALRDLRALAEEAAARPARRTTEQAKWLRDGQVRSLEITQGGATKTVSLSDGLDLTDADHRLVRALEELLR